LGAERIGHGVRVLEDPSIVRLARERGTAFEVCITSNYQSGVVENLTAHPVLRMISAGLVVTLATDDPSISQITLSHEYRIACEDLGLSDPILKRTILTAVQAAFLPDHQKNDLMKKISKELTIEMR